MPQDAANRVAGLIELEPGVSQEAAVELLELAQRHRLRYEIWPEKRVYSGHIKQVGFELDLIGDHYHPRHVPFPGCDECRSVYRALEKLAEFVLVKPERLSHFELQGFDGALRYPRQSGEHGYVTLTIRILHSRAPHDGPPDECELRCLGEMERKLDALGAQLLGKHLGDAIVAGAS